MADVAWATALAAAGQVDHACRVALTALATGRDLGSERVVHAVVSFRASLGITRSSATADLDRSLSQSYEEDL